MSQNDALAGSQLELMDLFTIRENHRDEDSLTSISPTASASIHERDVLRHDDDEDTLCNCHPGYAALGFLLDAAIYVFSLPKRPPSTLTPVYNIELPACLNRSDSFYNPKISTIPEEEDEETRNIPGEYLALESVDKILRSLHGSQRYYGKTHPVVGRTFLALGDHHARAKSYQKAAEAYSQALLCHISKLKAMEAYHGLGKVLLATHETARAIENLNQAEQLLQLQDNPDPRLLADIWYLLGTAHASERLYDAAVSYLNMSFKQYDKLSDIVSSCQCLDIKARIYFDKGDVDGARLLWLASLQDKKVILAGQVDKDSILHAPLTGLADTYAARGNFVEAVKYHREALVELKRTLNHGSSSKLCKLVTTTMMNLRARYDKIDEKTKAELPFRSTLGLWMEDHSSDTFIVRN
jgi:tetratricopeptide (TPR) repeat protein